MSTPRRPANPVLHLVPDRHGDKPCWQCRGPRTLSERYDSYYCESCDMWLESACNDAARCLFCAMKPKRPSLSEAVPTASDEEVYAAMKRITRDHEKLILALADVTSAADPVNTPRK